MNEKKTLSMVLRHQGCERVLKASTGRGYKGNVSSQRHQVSQQRSKTSKDTGLKINTPCVQGQNVNQGKQSKNTPREANSNPPTRHTVSQVGAGIMIYQEHKMEPNIPAWPTWPAVAMDELRKEAACCARSVDSPEPRAQAGRQLGLSCFGLVGHPSARP